ncbi:putative transporter SEO1 [Wickerhamomyces ciferrii]|uniref:Transporter SEO1 n=1 Tax=Wickerhamomyces ciferrii (strain ATCC 14091 / BCRC 22168 / CBS 111 / JCM 3599 / NBRC 0793 / NRRL Y-1031 F-60-10) TaxID=1206466 RepID=K0KHJ8_WICCF|nr:putative transporter SEO1 [Wickerhamomyces ciferrii]CCH42491.1 putative transporter SEO1 [Wickerhamomyces ciferrii]
MTDYSAWYWKFIPHYRDVKDPDLYDENGSEIIYDIHNSKDTQLIEYRDESNRKWYKVFDEYEYRLNKYKRQEKTWWGWFDKNATAQEKKFLTKLDFMIVLYSIAGFWSMNLNQANISNAYVSGMKEGLNMYGNELSNSNALYNAGCTIFQLVFMYVFPRVPLNYLFLIGNLGWSIITLASAHVQTAQQLYVSRFFVGAFESGYFILVHYLFGSWYKGLEINYRGGIFYCGLYLGVLTSGLLQGQIYESLNNVLGLPGWRWMFIIDGAITIPIAIYGFYVVPGTPENCTSLFLTDEEILLARRRLREANIVSPSRDPPPFLNWKLWKKVISSWPIYILMVMDGLFWNASGAVKNAGFALWLKSLNRYSTPELNRLTSIPPALAIAFVLAVCFSADIIKSRSIAILWGTTITLTTNLILAIWEVPESAKWYSFYLSYFGYTISSVVYGWLNDIMRHDPQERAIVLCAANIFSQQSTAWLVPLTFPTVEGPRFKKGYIFATVVDVVLLLWVLLTYFFYKREERKNAKINGIVLYNSSKGDVPLEVREHLASKSDDSESDVVGSQINENKGDFNEDIKEIREEKL